MNLKMDKVKYYEFDSKGYSIQLNYIEKVLSAKFSEVLFFFVLRCAQSDVLKKIRSVAVLIGFLRKIKNQNRLLRPQR